MRRAPVLLAASLLVAAHAAAQERPAATPEPAAAAPAPRLNLKLDKPARHYVRETPSEEAKAPAGGLPTLGADAVPIVREPAPRSTSSPYPKDSEQRQ